MTIRLINVAVLLLLLLSQGLFAADKIRIGYSGLSAGTAMLWATHEGRLFEKNGLDPDVLFLRNTLGQSAMIAGEIEMCSYSASLLAPARVQGADVVMIVSFQQKLNYRLVVRPEIRTIADLKGKVLGVTRYGTVNDSTMRLLLNKLGVNPERDVTLIQVGDSAPVVVTSLIAGKTFDGALLQPPYYNKAVESGMRVFANMEEMDIPFQQVGLNTTQRYIAKSPDMVRRVVKSIVEGVQLIRTHPERAKRAIGRYMQIKDEKVLEESYQQLKATSEIKPYPSVEGFKTILGELAKKLPAARTANPRDFMDVRFIQELDKSGYIDGLYR
ncbi:MAG: ABC transporter substrate-binding protein [Deltaproteobacteria bacterium]|nr:ABC transporter substrate-binding protein [Deltaproteobacteria bacterium]